MEKMLSLNLISLQILWAVMGCLKEKYWSVLWRKAEECTRQHSPIPIASHRPKVIWTGAFAFAQRKYVSLGGP